MKIRKVSPWCCTHVPAQVPGTVPLRTASMVYEDVRTFICTVVQTRTPGKVFKRLLLISIFFPESTISEVVIRLVRKFMANAPIMKNLKWTEKCIYCSLTLLTIFPTSYFQREKVESRVGGNTPMGMSKMYFGLVFHLDTLLLLQVLVDLQLELELQQLF